MKGFLNGLREWSTHIPLVGAYFHIKWAAVKESFGEVLASTVFSLLPVWLSALVFTIKARFSSPEYEVFGEWFWMEFERMVSSGELLMYATAVLGPVIYLGLTTTLRKQRWFPWYRSIFFLAIILGISNTALFFEARNTGFANQDEFVRWTIIIYLISLFFLFPFVANREANAGDPPGKKRREDQEEFVTDYARHRAT